MKKPSNRDLGKGFRSYFPSAESAPPYRKRKIEMFGTLIIHEFVGHRSTLKKAFLKAICQEKYNRDKGAASAYVGGFEGNGSQSKTSSTAQFTTQA